MTVNFSHAKVWTQKMLEDIYQFLSNRGINFDKYFEFSKDHREDVILKDFAGKLKEAHGCVANITPYKIDQQLYTLSIKDFRDDAHGEPQNMQRNRVCALKFGFITDSHSRELIIKFSQWQAVKNGPDFQIEKAHVKHSRRTTKSIKIVDLTILDKISLRKMAAIIKHGSRGYHSIALFIKPLTSPKSLTFDQREKITDIFRRNFLTEVKSKDEIVSIFAKYGTVIE